MTAFPRVLLAERRCTTCGCIFARVPDKTIDPERCGFCLALNDSLRFDLEHGLIPPKVQTA